ncbi:MAG: hypothetical protein NWE86_07725, partial [Candidatus Bathyarchaeota archaeon]|nr:hypothetical protein [Candidatus Bathyarchaeota archaeon]
YSTSEFSKTEEPEHETPKTEEYSTSEFSKTEEPEHETPKTKEYSTSEDSTITEYTKKENEQVVKKIPDSIVVRVREDF